MRTLIKKLKALRLYFVSILLQDYLYNENKKAYIAGYKYMRENCEMNKYPFDDAAKLTAEINFSKWYGNKC